MSCDFATFIIIFHKCSAIHFGNCIESNADTFKLMLFESIFNMMRSQEKKKTKTNNDDEVNLMLAVFHSSRKWNKFNSFGSKSISIEIQMNFSDSYRFCFHPVAVSIELDQSHVNGYEMNWFSCVSKFYMFNLFDLLNALNMWIQLPQDIFSVFSCLCVN